MQRNDPAPYGAVRPSVFGCGNLRRLVRTFGWSPRATLSRGIIVDINYHITKIYRTFRRRGRVRAAGRRPWGAKEPKSRPAGPRPEPYGSPRRRAAAAVYDKVISSLNVVVAGSRSSLASFILRSRVFRHIAASGPGASAFNI